MAQIVNATAPAPEEALQKLGYHVKDSVTQARFDKVRTMLLLLSLEFLLLLLLLPPLLLLLLRLLTRYLRRRPAVPGRPHQVGRSSGLAQGAYLLLLLLLLPPLLPAAAVAARAAPAPANAAPCSLKTAVAAAEASNWSGIEPGEELSSAVERCGPHVAISPAMLRSSNWSGIEPGSITVTVDHLAEEMFREHASHVEKDPAVPPMAVKPAGEEEKEDELQTKRVLRLYVQRALWFPSARCHVSYAPSARAPSVQTYTCRVTPCV